MYNHYVANATDSPYLLTFGAGMNLYAFWLSFSLPFSFLFPCLLAQSIKIARFVQL